MSVDVAARVRARAAWHRANPSPGTRSAVKPAPQPAIVYYRQMVAELPEGGAITLRWPDHIEIDSVEMMRDLFALQWGAVERVAIERTARQEANDGNE